MQEVEIIWSKRKSAALELRRNGRLIVRVPQTFSEEMALKMVEKNRGWILKQREKLLAQPPAESPLTEEEIEDLKMQAKVYFPDKVAYYAPLVGVEVEHIGIRMQKSRWGSCSTKGNLNFNCLLMLAPEFVREYVVVHELCHRKQMNHSPEFWAEVARVLPAYKQAKEWLKEEGPRVLERAFHN